MGAVPQRILNWLHGALTSEYRNIDRTYSDVVQTLSFYTNLSLRTDVYTFDNGRSSLLLNAHGTLPVAFRGLTYAFPISLWIPQEYPAVGPIGFVSPAKDMVLRPGQHVGVDGRIYHPYLANWGEAGGPNLLDFLAILQDVFAREPPLIAKQTPRQQILQPSQRSQPARENIMPPPVPPLPPELDRPESSARPTSNQLSQQPPPPPPKPFEVRSPSQANDPPPLPPVPYRHDSQYTSADPQSQNGYRRDPPPLPQKAPQRTDSLKGGSVQDPGFYTQTDQSLNQTLRRDIRSFTNTSQPDYWQENHVQSVTGSHESRYSQQAPPLQASGHPRNSNTTSYQNGYQQNPHQQRLPQYPQHFQRQPLPQQQQQQQQPQPQPPKPKPPEDLLTSPFETPLPTQPTNIAPPPVPPNPHKDALLSALSQTFTHQIHSTHSSNLAAFPPLRAQQAALTFALTAINEETFQLNDLEAMLSSNEKILHQAMRDADKVLDDARQRKTPNVDEVLVAPTVVAGQLYASVAEERAIEESRTVLGKALDKGRIGGSVWAKQTRSLAREEFLKKALIKKISRGMGLVQGR